MIKVAVKMSQNKLYHQKSGKIVSPEAKRIKAQFLPVPFSVESITWVEAGVTKSIKIEIKEVSVYV